MLAGGGAEHAESIRREAFRSIRRGEAADPAGLAERTGLRVNEVERALDVLSATEAIRRDETGRVVASAGLSVSETRHRLLLSGTELFTWCAIDALGIPAALGEDALATTSCPHCGRAVEIEIRKGRVLAPPDAVVWVPSEACSTSEFCAQANLFCDEAHLEAWRAHAGRPPGRALPVPEVEPLGRQWWRAMG